MSNSWVPPHSARRAAEQGAETLEGFSDWQQIGRGGDAIVYRAVQDALDREVAIKVLTVDDTESIRRFTREVQLMMTLGRQHPNIARVLQIGTSSQGRPCIVMDYYELGSLDMRLSRHGPLSADEVIRMGTVIADALAFAHSKGVLHRDVKPQNILILPQSYVLADFGIARLIDSAHTLSTDRFSYRHASPQVLDGYPPTESDDIFSLGATMFHLLDGKPPFTTGSSEPDSALAYIKRVRIAEPRLLLHPDLPAGLAELIERCLRKDPAERFPSAVELRDRLVAFGGNKPVVSPALPTGRTPSDVSFAAPVETGIAPAATATSPLVHPPGDSPVRPWWRMAPLLGIVIGGVLLGALLGWTFFRPFIDMSGLLPASPSTPASSTAPAAPPLDDRYNPNLTPRSLRVTVSGAYATAVWDRSIDEPEAYGWGVTSHPDASVEIDNRNLPGERTAQVAIDPAWDQVCFTVVGVRGAQLGGDKSCVPL